MKSSRYVGLALLSCALASPVWADVTLKSKGGGSGLVAGMSGDMTQYVKGMKLRIDQTTGKGRETTTIIDVAARQMIVLDHESKEVEIIDMTFLSESLNKVGASEFSTSITPTAQTRQIAGQSCTVYDLKVSIPMQVANTEMMMVMSGPQCIAKNGPGHADYAAFYRAAADKGFFFDATQAKGRPATAKAMTDMYRKMAELGVPLTSEMKMGAEGTGPMAEAMKKMASTITTEVTSVSTAAIPDVMFEVPAGYKVKKR